MRKLLLFIPLLFVAIFASSCKSEEEKSIELVQATKAAEINIDGISGAGTWLDYANEQVKNEPNKIFKWEAKKTDTLGVYLVAFKDEKGWGRRWEVTLKEKLVKDINSNDYLSMKYGLSRFDSEMRFKVSNIETAKLSIEKERVSQDFWSEIAYGAKYQTVVVYRFEGDVTNNTDKFITAAQLDGKLKLIFQEKTIVGANSSVSFKSSISTSKPWEPGATKRVVIKTTDIDRVYLKIGRAHV